MLSKNFLLFDVRTDLVTGAWLVLVLGSPQVVEVLGRRATGSAHQIYPKKDILALEIPLPPLAEQGRVVARIEELAAQIHEARTLHHQTAEKRSFWFRVREQPASQNSETTFRLDRSANSFQWLAAKG